MNGWIPSPERKKLFDLTPPLIYDDYRIIVKWPDEMDRWTEVARPFDSVVCFLNMGFLVYNGFIYIFFLYFFKRHG